jgi:hypothetical protein
MYASHFTQSVGRAQIILASANYQICVEKEINGEMVS